MRNVEPQAALGVGFDDIAELPADGIGRNRTLQGPNPARAQDALEKSAEDATDAHVNLQDVEHGAPITAVGMPVPGVTVAPMPVAVPDLESNVIDPDYFAPVHIDNLLVQQIAADAQHVLVRVVRSELLVCQTDALE